MEKSRPASTLLILKKIFEETSSTTGREFFRVLVKNLAESLELHGVWVTTYDRKLHFLRSQAFWLEDHFVDQYDYAVPGTPCEPVLQSNEIFHVPDKVIKLYPNDPDLAPLGAVSYMGIALRSEDGSIIGHLAALDNKPMHELPEYFALFRIFAARAEAELRRINYEKRILENENKVSRLINGAVNGILEVDENLMITQTNPAAQSLFGCEKPAEIIGRSLKEFVSDMDYHKLLNSISKLHQEESNNISKWIRDHFTCKNRLGLSFKSETSISSYQYNEKSYYVIFFIDVEEKLKAQTEVKKLLEEKEILKEEIKELKKPGNIIGNSPSLLNVLKWVSQVAPTDATVLITGETGTGKELIARAIHEQSQRKDQNLITVNCAALPSELIESELFGHVKGAFTGAHTNKNGLFYIANKSTIFLDEVGELPIALQSKLLRVLQEGEFQPLGSVKTFQTDVRVITATNRDLQEEVNKGNFREDLFYRLNVFPIHLPPLRERGDDVLLIAEYFIQKFTEKMNRKPAFLKEKDRQILMSYSWPGNIRELQNTIERALILSSSGHLNINILQHTTQEKMEADPHVSSDNIYTVEEIRNLERKNIIRALHAANWKISGKYGAASILKTPPTTLTSRMKALGITRENAFHEIA